MANPRSSIFAATFALLFISLAASSYQTTITRVKTNDDVAQGGQSQQKCSQAHEQIMACQAYLLESTRSQGGMWREEFPRCCQQLEQVEEQCQCEALKGIVQKLQQSLKGGMRGEQLTETMLTARSLPVMCRIPPQQYCEVREASSF